LAHRPLIDWPGDGSVSLQLEDVTAAELEVLCKTLTAYGPAVGKVRLERSQDSQFEDRRRRFLLPVGLGGVDDVNLKPFFEALQCCTHVSNLR
jgi:hypothetical protein